MFGRSKLSHDSAKENVKLTQTFLLSKFSKFERGFYTILETRKWLNAVFDLPERRSQENTVFEYKIHQKMLQKSTIETSELKFMTNQDWAPFGWVIRLSIDSVNTVGIRFDLICANRDPHVEFSRKQPYRILVQVHQDPTKSWCTCTKSWCRCTKIRCTKIWCSTLLIHLGLGSSSKNV